MRVCAIWHAARWNRGTNGGPQFLSVKLQYTPLEVCYRESYIYGANDCDNMTAWSCRCDNRLPSATLTVGHLFMRAPALCICAIDCPHTCVRQRSALSLIAQQLTCSCITMQCHPYLSSYHAAGSLPPQSCPPLPPIIIYGCNVSGMHNQLCFLFFCSKCICNYM